MKVPDRDYLMADWEKTEKAPHMICLEMPVMTKQITAWIEPGTRREKEQGGSRDTLVPCKAETASENERQRGRHPGRRKPRLVAEAA